MKRTVCLLFAVLFAFALCACDKIGGITINTPTADADGTEDFTVYTLSLGKADCIVLKTSAHLAVIDLGVKDLASDVVSFISSFGIPVDVLIITHYDRDHIGAAKKLLGSVSVKDVYLPEYEDEKPENAEEVKGYLDKHGIEPSTVTEKRAFTLDGVAFTVYPSDIFFKRNDNGSNESSLVITAEHGENLFLFAGDATDKRLPEILTQLPDPSAVDYLKVPHHGVYDENSAAFFAALRPRFAVITCSAADPADGSTVKLLRDVGAQVFLTTDGTVRAVSDGKEITVGYVTV